MKEFLGLKNMTNEMFFVSICLDNEPLHMYVHSKNVLQPDDQLL